MDCIFCKIANKEIPGLFVHEDEHAFAILDVHPHAPGHTMVIPKIHAPTVLDLPDGEIGPVFTMVKKVTARLNDVLQPDGFTIGVNHGDAAGQAVKHLHIHIMPRFKGDGGGNVHSVVSNPGKDSPQDLAAKLKF
jgi:histidine triad (HIT) family protein